MKADKSGAFVRDGVAVELMLDRGDTYDAIIDKSSEVIDLTKCSSWTSSHAFDQWWCCHSPRRLIGHWGVTCDKCTRVLHKYVWELVW